MNKIVLLGVRDLATDETIDPQTDYQITLVAQRISEEKEDQDSDDKQVIKYRLKIERIDSLINLKTNSDIKFEKGKTPSQKMRFRIEQELGEYDSFMKWHSTKLGALIEEYKESLDN